MKKIKKDQDKYRQEAINSMWEEVEKPHTKKDKKEKNSKASPCYNGKANALVWSRKKRVMIRFNCPKCGMQYNVICAKGIYFSIKTICPRCHTVWKKHYWKTTIAVILFIIMLYILGIPQVLHTIGI